MATVNRPPARPHTKGPVELLFTAVSGLVFVTLFAWFVGCFIEVVGSFTLWRGQGFGHSQQIVQQDLGYIAAAPRSLLVGDTVAMSQRILRTVQTPYEKLGVLRWYERTRQPKARAQATVAHDGEISVGLQKGTAQMAFLLSEWAVMSMFVLQDVLLRLSVAVYALPAFVLACLLGTIDGLVRRDIRRWSGGRESSFIYHHAKRYTAWALTGGFSLYLTWPFGGFNPAYMVLVFTILVASTLSTTVAAFKKYV